MVIILGLILTLTGTAFLYMSGSERVFSHREIYPASAFWIAEAGAEHGKAWLEKEVKNTLTPPVGTENFQRDFGIGRYEVTITPPGADNPGGYRIVSVAEVETNTRAGTVTVEKEIILSVSMKSFARYAYFTNNEYNPDIGQTIWFTNHDISYGPVHSNSRINIYRNPVFHGKVTSTANSFNYFHGGWPQDNPDFRAGYELGADNIDMDKFGNLQRLKDAANSGGIFIEGASTVTLLGNNVSYTERYWQWPSWRTRTVTRALDSFNGALYATGDVTVSGPGSADARVNERLTVTSERDIMITHRVRYNVPPDNPACTGMLGLVAGRKIQVSSSAPSNMVIHATLMAFDESFSVQNYDSISPKGTLNVWGGIIQNYRGPVGTFWSATGQIASGYAKDYRYDDRVTSNPPPFFPTVEKGLDVYFDIGRWEQAPVEPEQ